MCLSGKGDQRAEFDPTLLTLFLPPARRGPVGIGGCHASGGCRSLPESHRAEGAQCHHKQPLRLCGVKEQEVLASCAQEVCTRRQEHLLHSKCSIAGNRSTRQSRRRTSTTAVLLRERLAAQSQRYMASCRLWVPWRKTSGSFQAPASKEDLCKQTCHARSVDLISQLFLVVTPVLT